MKIVFASNNEGKILEITAFLKNAKIEVIPQGQLAILEIPETGLSFVENALLKARHAASTTKLPCIADDSGLVVPVLNGAPGIYSARYAGEQATSRENNQKLLSELVNIPKQQRYAFFYCVLVFMRHALDPTPIICEGRWEGLITDEFLGEQGFGYDPIFYIPDLNKTAAQLSLDMKNKHSHRGQALFTLLKNLSSGSVSTNSLAEKL